MVCEPINKLFLVYRVNKPAIVHFTLGTGYDSAKTTINVFLREIKKDIMNVRKKTLWRTVSIFRYVASTGMLN